MKQITITKHDDGLYHAVAVAHGSIYYADGYLRWVDAWDAIMKLVRGESC